MINNLEKALRNQALEGNALTDEEKKFQKNLMKKNIYELAG